MSFKPSKLLTNSWTITLSATLIGVFVALYLIAYFTGSKDPGDKNEKIINHIKLMINFEESLVDIYKQSKKELGNCN